MVLISVNDSTMWCKPLYSACYDFVKKSDMTCFISLFSHSGSVMISYPTLHSCSNHDVSVTPCSYKYDGFHSFFPSPLSFCPSILQELLPLVLSFELPAIMQSDPSSPTVQHISQTYNLTVSFKPPTRLYRATGVVRGSQNNANAVKVRRVS